MRATGGRARVPDNGIGWGCYLSAQGGWSVEQKLDADDDIGVRCLGPKGQQIPDDTARCRRSHLHCGRRWTATRAGARKNLADAQIETVGGRRRIIDAYGGATGWRCTVLNLNPIGIPGWCEELMDQTLTGPWRSIDRIGVIVPHPYNPGAAMRRSQACGGSSTN